MIQNFFAIKNAVNYNDKLYFVPGNYNSLFELDIKKNWEIRCICDFPWEGRADAIECILIQDKVWCISTYGVQIASYDFTCNKVEYYSDKKVKERENITFIIRDDIIWFIPRIFPDLLIGFSTSKNEFIYDKIVYDKSTKEIYLP